MDRLIKLTVDRWSTYKDDFFIKSGEESAEGILKASFAIGYFLFNVEYMNETPDRIMAFNSVNAVKNATPLLIESSRRTNLPGLDYATPSGYSGAVILKKQLLSKSYEELEHGMISQIRSRKPQLNLQMPLKNIFKQTGYASTSKYINVFFFHSLVMFGWYMCYGYYRKSNGTTVVKDFPGSCNVMGCINMYLFKMHNALDKIIYTPHGGTRVSSIGSISKMTSQRASGIDDVQFCHHAFRLVGESHNRSSGYETNHYVKTLTSHVDAFDVLTLAPIFRCRQRLRRTGKSDRIKYIDELLDLLNTDIRVFIKEHRFSNLQGSRTFVSKHNNLIQNKANNSHVMKFKFKRFLENVANRKERGLSINSLKNKYTTNFNFFNRTRRAQYHILTNNKNALKNFTKNEIQLAKSITQ